MIGGGDQGLRRDFVFSSWLSRYTYRATIWMRLRIASPEMFLNAELLPHVNCSPMATERRGNDEAIEHGD